MSFLSRYLLPADGRFHWDFFSGLTVSLALIPEAIAFALVAHVNPLVGLYAAFFMCLITAVLGGRPGMISGATGSMAVVYVSLVVQHGLQYLLATVILTGLLEIVIGVLRLGKLIRLMPKSVMVGFVNGLAIVIFLSQLNQLKVMDAQGGMHWLTGSAMYTMLALIATAMLITHYLPKWTKGLPAALTAIVVVSLIVFIGHVPTRVVSDMMSGYAMSAHFPDFSVPSIPVNWHSVGIIFPYACVLAVIGLSESLMTLALIDERTHTHGRGNRECIAQGIGNIVCGFFNSMGGCAMIGQSMINITSGGRGRLSGITAGVFLLLFILLLWPFIEHIPLAALVGVMFMVVLETFEWATFHFIRKIPFHDGLIIVMVTVVTVLTNLATAVLIGVIMAALQFAWQSAKNIHASTHSPDDGHKEYVMEGPLFFGSTSTFKSLFLFNTDPIDVVIDFRQSRVYDHSAIDAIHYVIKQYQMRGKQIHLRHLSPECKQLLGKAGKLVETRVKEDPCYCVASDVLD